MAGNQQKLFVPIIDMSAFGEGSRSTKQSLARMVDDAFTTSGFLTLVNHNVPAATIQNAQRELHAFFQAPVEEKMATYSEVNTRGYAPVEHHSVTSYDGVDAPMDLREGFSMGSFETPAWETGEKTPWASEDGENLWPIGRPAFRNAMEDYYRAVECLAYDFMRLCALALRLDEDFFVPFYKDYSGIIRANLYPKQTREPKPGQMRIGPHTDVGAFTILLVGEGAGGLQIRDENGDWHDVASPPGSFVINIGEILRMWTNGRWRATYHRVVNPRTPEENVPRLSVPFFANPNPDIVIEAMPTCIDPGATPAYEPVKSGAYRKARLETQYSHQKVA